GDLVAMAAHRRLGERRDRDGVPERVLERACEERSLGVSPRALGEMLEVAAAAVEEVRTEWNGAVGARLEDLDDLAAAEATARLGDADADELAGDSAGDEDHVAVGARHRVRSERKRLDPDRDEGAFSQR